jgi:hypothetical protein
MVATPSWPIDLKGEMRDDPKQDEKVERPI